MTQTLPLMSALDQARNIRDDEFPVGFTHDT
jgi:hypothetical protein